MPETANLRLDAAYGRLQSMIEEVGRAIWKRRSRKHIRIRAQLNDWRAKLLPTFNSGWSPTMYQQRTPSTVSRSVISTWRPVGLVIGRGFGAGIDISLSTPVRNVHWHADAVWLHTPHGVGRARAALITA